jgi:hypothetical protein
VVANLICPSHGDFEHNIGKYRKKRGQLRGHDCLLLDLLAILNLFNAGTVYYVQSPAFLVGKASDQRMGG